MLGSVPRKLLLVRRLKHDGFFARFLFNVE